MSVEKEEYDRLRAKFLKLASSVPIPLRKEIIAFVDKEAINWDAAAEELRRETEKSRLILDQLKEIGLI